MSQEMHLLDDSHQVAVPCQSPAMGAVADDQQVGIVADAAVWDRALGREVPAAMRGWPAAAAIALHAGIALLYTTIWDNYLVATRVWWYDPALVTGITIAYVPIEEYTFFILQPILAGLLLLFFLRRMRLPAGQPASKGGRVRFGAVAAMTAIWLGSVALLASGWQSGIYMGLELVWAIPPIALQLAFGADILWHYRWLVGAAILTFTGIQMLSSVGVESWADLKAAGQLRVEGREYIVQDGDVIYFRFNV